MKKLISALSLLAMLLSLLAVPAFAEPADDAVIGEILNAPVQYEAPQSESGTAQTLYDGEPAGISTESELRSAFSTGGSYILTGEYIDYISD